MLQEMSASAFGLTGFCPVPVAYPVDTLPVRRCSPPRHSSTGSTSEFPRDTSSSNSGAVCSVGPISGDGAEVFKQRLKRSPDVQPGELCVQNEPFGDSVEGFSVCAEEALTVEPDRSDHLHPTYA